MTRDEVKQIVMVITYTFPNFKPDDVSMLINAWAAILADEDGKAIEQALIRYCKSANQFAPSPGDLISMTKAPQMNEMEAWSLVRKAISNGYYGAEEEYAKLPDDVKRAVGSPSQLRAWAMDSGFNEGVAMSQFQRVYRTQQEREATKPTISVGKVLGLEDK